MPMVIVDELLMHFFLFQLDKMDKMLSGTSKKKTVGRERGANLPRPNSDLHLDELEEDQYNLDNLSDDQVQYLELFISYFLG